MGSSRRDRAKKESTFLEDVKGALTFLLNEVSDIKHLLNRSNVTIFETASFEFPPPAPPPLDVISRDLFLQHRQNLSNHSNRVELDMLPKTAYLLALERDEITDFLEAQGHFATGANANIQEDVDGAQKLVESIAEAQKQASALREAEKAGKRMTFEAMKAEADRGGPNVPSNLSNENLGDYFLAHLDIACSTLPIENRRPYLQQQIWKLEKCHTLSDEAGKLLLEIMERYAPSYSIDEELRFMCSDCGALYQNQDTQCAVCQGFDIFDVVESSTERKDWTTTSNCESEGADALSDFEELPPQPKSFMRASSFPNFMQNRSVASSSSSTPGVSVDKEMDPSASHVDYRNENTCRPGSPNVTQAVYYAVRGGSKPGVYCSFDEVSSACKGSQTAQVKKFTDWGAARDFASICA